MTGYYGFMFDIHVSVHPSIVPCVCLSVNRLSVRQSIHIWFPDDILSKHQWIFSKLDMCISGLGLLMGKFHQILIEFSARDIPIFSFPEDNLSKCEGAGLGGSVGYAVRLETKRSRVQPPPRSATFFRGD